jgi:hypothetical protein
MTTDPRKALGGALEYLIGISPDDITDGALPEITSHYSHLIEIQTVVRDLLDHVAEQIAERMETDQMTITGVGSVVRKPRTSSTWIHEDSREQMLEDAVSAIVQRVALDPATGEVYAPLANTARETFRLVQDAFSIGADPKMAFRKVLGLQPDEYRSKRVTGYNIVIEEETL